MTDRGVDPSVVVMIPALVLPMLVFPPMPLTVFGAGPPAWIPGLRIAIGVAVVGHHGRARHNPVPHWRWRWRIRNRWGRIDDRWGIHHRRWSGLGDGWRHIEDHGRQADRNGPPHVARMGAWSAENGGI